MSRYLDPAISEPISISTTISLPISISRLKEPFKGNLGLSLVSTLEMYTPSHGYRNQGHTCKDLGRGVSQGSFLLWWESLLRPLHCMSLTHPCVFDPPPFGPRSTLSLRLVYWHELCRRCSHRKACRSYAARLLRAVTTSPADPCTRNPSCCLLHIHHQRAQHVSQEATELEGL